MLQRYACELILQLFKYSVELPMHLSRVCGSGIPVDASGSVMLPVQGLGCWSLVFPVLSFGVVFFSFGFHFSLYNSHVGAL